MAHCVRVVLKLAGGGLPEEVAAIRRLENRMQALVRQHGTGEYDGDDFGDGRCTLYLYGPDADRLYQSICEPLVTSPMSFGGHVIKRYGEPGEGEEVRVDF